MNNSSIMFDGNEPEKTNDLQANSNEHGMGRNTFLSGIFNSKNKQSFTDNDDTLPKSFDALKTKGHDNISLSTLSGANISNRSSKSFSPNPNSITHNSIVDRMIESDQESSSDNEEQTQNIDKNYSFESDTESDSESMKHFRANIHSLDSESDNDQQEQTESNTIVENEYNTLLQLHKSKTDKSIEKINTSIDKSTKNNDINLNEDDVPLFVSSKGASNNKNLFKKDLNDHMKPLQNNLEGSFLFRKKSTWPTYNARANKDDDIDLEFNGNKRKTYKKHNTNMKNNIISLSKKEKALWKWANIENLDLFLIKVYNYYLGSGFQCIMMEKVLNLFTLVFITFVGSYSTNCINYSKFHDAQKLQDILIDQCFKNSMSRSSKMLIYFCVLYVVLKVVTIYNDYKDLSEIHDFYHYLLDIDDLELQTISWQNIVAKIMELKDSNALTANVNEIKAKNRIDAHDIANRIMRKENYLIALFNSNTLDLDLKMRLPFNLPYKWETVTISSNLTKTLEWNINLCILGFAFNEQGYLKHYFLKKSQRNQLAVELRKRFMVAGFLNIILSPLLVSYFVLLYFFRYFNEYKTMPGALSTRQYTLRAEWKLREYNELYHLFQKRLGLSIEIADDYVNQFPNELKNLIFKFVAFISGSFVAILATFTLFFDSENFLNFEITKEKSVLFYLSIFGTLYTICRNSISDQYKIFDPELYMDELIKYTHYSPKRWENRLHTQEVRDDFCKLYELKIAVLFKELSSLILTPFVLWFKLPEKCDEIVDFFRNVSVYVDGLGYVCKYAVFEQEDRDNSAKNIIKEESRKLKKNEKRQSIRAILEKRFEENNNTNKSGFRNQELNNIEEDSDLISSHREKNHHMETEDVNDKIMQSYIHFVDNYSNQEYNVGKTAIPRHVELNRNYSWKKQFGFSHGLENSTSVLFNRNLRPIESLSPNTSAIQHQEPRRESPKSDLKKEANTEKHDRRTRHNLAESDSFIHHSGRVNGKQSARSIDHSFGANQNINSQNFNNGSYELRSAGHLQDYPDSKNKGVLGLLKQYYKDADVGR